MKVLITGATGFVGACLTRRLVKSGYEVNIFSRKQSNKWRIADLIQHIADHEVDLGDCYGVQKAIQKIKPQIIYHLATYGGFAFQQDTKAIIESNFIGTVNLLRACESIEFDYFVNTGSSSEYGFKQQPMKEIDIPEPVGDYGVTKVASTLFCQAEAIQKNLPIITARLFSPYGNWDDPKRLIPYVIKSLLRGDVPKLSNPNSVRDYIFIDDVLDFYEMIVKEPLATGNIYNVGSGNQYSIGDVVDIITQIIGNGVQPIWGSVESQRPEPTKWVADITKVSLLGWEPKYDLRHGLQQTVSWMQDNLELYIKS